MLAHMITGQKESSVCVCACVFVHACVRCVDWFWEQKGGMHPDSASLCKTGRSERSDLPCGPRWCFADMVLDHQEASSELDDSVRVKVRDALLKRHHHQNEKKKNLIPIVRSITEGTRKQSEPHLIGGNDT